MSGTNDNVASTTIDLRYWHLHFDVSQGSQIRQCSGELCMSQMDEKELVRREEERHLSVYVLTCTDVPVRQGQSCAERWCRACGQG